MDLERLLVYCRFSRRYRGFRELEDCVKIVVEDEERLLYMTGIYIDVGLKHKKAACSVERNIRTIIKYSWQCGGKEVFEEISGGKLYSKPTVSEVIEMLACYMKGCQKNKQE